MMLLLLLIIILSLFIITLSLLQQTIDDSSYSSLYTAITGITLLLITFISLIY